MPYNIYDLGRYVRVWATFKSGDTGSVIDPDTVKLSVQTPAGAVTTYTYGVDANVIKEDVGKYYARIDANQPAFWFYRWWSIGFGQTAAEKEFKVRTAQAI